ncbi:MAG: hypothetical protein WD225_07755 [Ilumatobacteraceae bacterium]
MSETRGTRAGRGARRPASVLRGDQGWSSEPPDAPRMRARQEPSQPSAPRAPEAPRAPRGPSDAPEAPRAPTGPSAPRPAAGRDRGDDQDGNQDGNRARLRRALSSPRATQQAFLLREVLGPPVSLREGRDDRPG